MWKLGLSLISLKVSLVTLLILAISGIVGLASGAFSISLWAILLTAVWSGVSLVAVGYLMAKLKLIKI